MRPITSCLGETRLTESKLFLASSRASRQLSPRVDVSKDAFEHELGHLGIECSTLPCCSLSCASCVDPLQSTLLTQIAKCITYLGTKEAQPWSTLVGRIHRVSTQTCDSGPCIVCDDSVVPSSNGTTVCNALPSLATRKGFPHVHQGPIQDFYIYVHRYVFQRRLDLSRSSLAMSENIAVSPAKPASTACLNACACRRRRRVSGDQGSRASVSDWTVLKNEDGRESLALPSLDSSSVAKAFSLALRSLSNRMLVITALHKRRGISSCLVP